MLARVTGVPEDEIREIVARHRREPTYRPIVVINDATLEQVAAVAARRLELELPDVVVQEVPTRQYPSGLARRASDRLRRRSERRAGRRGRRSRSAPSSGRPASRRTTTRMLMGQDGARRVVVNSLGREIQRARTKIEPVEGRRVQLTIDLAMQKAAEEGVSRTSATGASAIVLDPRTGDVLTLVSLPAYDPNAFAGGIDRATWQALITDKLRPLQNRAIQGRYSPGSTFKLVVATAALEEGLVTPDFTRALQRRRDRSTAATSSAT